MKTKRNAAISLAIVPVVLSAFPWAKCQNRANKKAQAAPKPTPEMDRLKFYLGEWDYTETYLKTASNPNGGKNPGIYTSKLGPGGNSLINTFHSKGPAGDFEGLLILTWDAKEKAYKMYVFGNNFPGAIVETGQFEGDALVFRSEISTPEANMKLRNVTRLAAPGRIESEQYFAAAGSPEALFVRVEAQKK